MINQLNRCTYAEIRTPSLSRDVGGRLLGADEAGS